MTGFKSCATPCPVSVRVVPITICMASTFCRLTRAFLWQHSCKGPSWGMHAQCSVLWSVPPPPLNKHGPQLTIIINNNNNIHHHRRCRLFVVHSLRSLRINHSLRICFTPHLSFASRASPFLVCLPHDLTVTTHAAPVTHGPVNSEYCKPVYQP